MKTKENNPDKWSSARSMASAILLILGFYVMLQTSSDQDVWHILIGFGMWMIAVVISLFQNNYDY